MRRPSPGHMAPERIHLDGFSGWRFAIDPEGFEGLRIERSGLTLAPGPLEPDPNALPVFSQSRGIAEFGPGFFAMPNEEGDGLSLSSDCDRMAVPDQWGFDELARAEIRAIAADHQRIFIALPDRNQVWVLGLKPQMRIAVLDIHRPMGLAVVAGELFVLCGAEATVVQFDRSLRRGQVVSLPAHHGVEATQPTEWRGLAVDVSGWWALVPPGVGIWLRDPSGEFSQHDIGRTLPAVALLSSDHGTPTLNAHLERGGRVAEYAIGPDAAGDGLELLRQSVSGPDISGVVAVRERIFVRTPDCRVTELAFETSGFYATRSTILFGPFDSGDLDTEWHRVVARVDKRGEGKCCIEVEVLTTNECDDFDPGVVDGEPSSDPRWGPSIRLLAPGEGLVAEGGLIAARGRFAYLRVTLSGDGRAAPLIEWLRVEYPRESYLDFLPAVFQEDEESREFLSRYLSIPQAEHAQLDALLASLPSMFSPMNAAERFLPWLAERIGLFLSPHWDESTTRKALARAFDLFLRRGTRSAFEEMLVLYVGPGVAVIEAHRQRSGFVLSGGAALGCNTGLPGGCGSDAMQLGRRVRLGEGRLDPDIELGPRGAVEGRGELWLYVPPFLLDEKAAKQRLDHFLERETPAGVLARVLRSPDPIVGRSALLGISTIFRKRVGWWLAESDSPGATAGPWLLDAAPDERATIEMGNGPRLGMGSHV